MRRLLLAMLLPTWVSLLGKVGWRPVVPLVLFSYCGIDCGLLLVIWPGRGPGQNTI